jgi:hypothetical protein
MATRVRFSKSEFRKELMKRKREYEVEQTARLIAYAKEQIVLMAKEIEQIITSQEGSTGNLLDSLCWGVWHNKKRQGLGYYRNESAIEDSYLHELSPMIRESVNGHFLAQQFLAQYQDNLTITDGWQVVWGVLAPYYAYWEQGHINKLLGGQFVQFTAMSQRYDHIKNELGPRCRADFNVTVPTY